MAVQTGSPEPIAALNRVKILEYARPWSEREALVDIRGYCPDVVCRPGICPYLRKTVADMLNRAQASLPPGYRLRVATALRTLSMQKRGWDNYFQKMRTEHPNWPLSALRRATNKYHAPYDQKAPPGHCTGGAVDVGLQDPDGNLLDMIAPTQGWEAAATFSDKLGPEAKANRMMMVEAMLGAGFSNCRDEYWHYSYGDSAWAVRVGETVCSYGWTYPPATLETDFEGASASDLSLEFERDSQGRVVRAHGHCSVVSHEVRISRSVNPSEKAREDGREGIEIEGAEGETANHFAVGIYWLKEVPLSLRLYPVLESPLYIGDGNENWEPVTTYTRERYPVSSGGTGEVSDFEGQEMECLRLHIEPPFDRSVLTTRFQNFLKTN